MAHIFISRPAFFFFLVLHNEQDQTGEENFVSGFLLKNFCFRQMSHFRIENLPKLLIFLFLYYKRGNGICHNYINGYINGFRQIIHFHIHTLGCNFILFLI